MGERRYGVSENDLVARPAIGITQALRRAAVVVILDDVITTTGSYWQRLILAAQSNDPSSGICHPRIAAKRSSDTG
jgi:hypothetical protein